MSETHGNSAGPLLNLNGAARRVWRITALTDNLLGRLPLTVVAAILVAIAWTMLAIGFVLSNVLMAPWRLPRDERSDPVTALM